MFFKLRNFVFVSFFVLFFFFQLHVVVCNGISYRLQSRNKLQEDNENKSYYHQFKSTSIPLFNSMKMKGPLPPGYNETYGYPDGIGGLIIEGPLPYKNGPSSYSEPDNLLGAYGLIMAPGSKDAHGNCDPLPKDSPFQNTKLFPVPFNNGLETCQIGCNITEVEETGVDPCHVGDIGSPYSNSPMSCFNIGSMAGGYGVCGYNCTALQYAETEKLVGCTQDDIGSGKCFIYCDSRTFPTEAQPTRIALK